MTVYEVMVALDIQANKHRVRGEYGYTSDVKKKSYRQAWIMLALCLGFFIIGKTLAQNVEPPFMVISAVLILPFAQNLARAISFSRYTPMDINAFKQLKTLNKGFCILGEMPIIRGKKTYFFTTIVITPKGIYGLMQSKADLKEAKKILENILQPKGYYDPIRLYTEFEPLYKSVQQQKSIEVQENMAEKMEKIATALLMKTHG